MEALTRSPWSRADGRLPFRSISTHLPSHCAIKKAVIHGSPSEPVTVAIGERGVDLINGGSAVGAYDLSA